MRPPRKFRLCLSFQKKYTRLIPTHNKSTNIHHHKGAHHA